MPDHRCEYEVAGIIPNTVRPCGEDATRFKIRGRWRFLCPEHYEFVLDAFDRKEIDAAKEEKKQKKLPF